VTERVPAPWLTRAEPVMRGHVIKSVQASGRTVQGDMRAAGRANEVAIPAGPGTATAPGGSGDGQGSGDAVEGGDVQDAS